eukprot:scaffold24187_cov66-Phaeocystis_antarctica.AAC.2
MRKLDGTTFAKEFGNSSASCFPHGLIGQSYDGDNMAVSGKTDDYTDRVEVTTTAMAEDAQRRVRAARCVQAQRAQGHRQGQEGGDLHVRRGRHQGRRGSREAGVGPDCGVSTAGDGHTRLRGVASETSTTILQEDQKDGIAGPARTNDCAHKGPGSRGEKTRRTASPDPRTLTIVRIRAREAVGGCYLRIVDEIITHAALYTF